MPLHPQSQLILDEAKASGLPPIYFLSVAKARERLTAAFTTKGEPEFVHMIKNVTIPGPELGIPLRIYIPSENSTLPILVFFHGGGWVVNNLETHDGLCRSIANQANCIVVSVDYRLAPENKFPAGIEDAYLATQWVANNAHLYNGDPQNIAVGGDSSGGTMAAVVAQLSQDRGGPKLVFQWLAYSPTDYFLPGTQSYKDLAIGYSMSRDWMIWFWNHYLPSDIDLNNPYICPLRSSNLRGLPPAFIMTAEYDPLKDDGELYAKKLQEAGVQVVFKCYEGLMHGFLLQRQRIDTANQGFCDAIAELSRAFIKG